MTTRITVIFDNAESPETFEAGLPGPGRSSPEDPRRSQDGDLQSLAPGRRHPDPGVPPDRLVPPRLRQG
jgi:hypothetical protein